ncbi:hypothetical protein QFC22_005414 [Naganishia vaughanmartiniae]|uniref:Uncharacterized protein n=1 Tax=Naganishia vaughanmartiniae TaxID=1424756 RepID=A0ACC2WUK7_9TREE|nr:hypothetical protein QFC22_005414 [Naganishia vaughanmartiniae]
MSNQTYPVNPKHSGQFHKAYDVSPGVLLINFNRMWREMVTSEEGTLTANHNPAHKAMIVHEHIKDFQSCISAIEEVTQPVIAAISGLCLGLGIDIASACDVRLVSDQASLGILEVNVGLAADIGTLQRFPKIVGSSSLARELALTGRRFTPAEATSMGFTSRVVPGGRTGVISEAVKMAKTIASKSPVAVVGTKRLMIRE